MGQKLRQQNGGGIKDLQLVNGGVGGEERQEPVNNQQKREERGLREGVQKSETSETYEEDSVSEQDKKEKRVKGQVDRGERGQIEREGNQEMRSVRCEVG